MERKNQLLYREGKAKILRYTIDSKAEKGNISMPE